MPTAAEVREQLAGPGGMFEITTDVVSGVPQPEIQDDELPARTSGTLLKDARRGGGVVSFEETM